MLARDPRALRSCMRVPLLFLTLTTVLFLWGCDDSNDPTQVDKACNKSESEVTLPAGAGGGIVIQAKRNSQCSVNISGLPNFEGPLKPGDSVVRTGSEAKVKMDCGSDAEKKCRYSYNTFGPKDKLTLAEDNVDTKCKDADTVLHLTGGNYSLSVEVDEKSQCSVTVSGAPSGDFSVESGKNKEVPVVLNAGQTAEIKLSCGSDDKNCRYHYKLKKNSR